MTASAWTIDIGRVWLGLVLLLAGGPARPARAEQPPLGDRYVDGAFGFAIRPPQGSQVDRQILAVASGGIQVVEFVRPSGPWRLAVTRCSTDRAVTVEEMLKGLPVDLIRRRPGGQILARRKAVIAARQAAVVAVSYFAEGVAWYVQEAVVWLEPTEFFRITFRTPLKDRAEATEAFEAVVRSFELIHSEQVLQTIHQATERGIGLLARLDGKRLLDKLVPESWFRFVIDGRNVGYLHVTESAAKRDGRPGVRIQEQTWMFEQDGSCKHIVSDFFLSDELDNEAWFSRMDSIFPPDKTNPLRRMTVIEQASRIEDTLVVARYDEPGQPEPDSQVLRLPKAYIPTVVQRLLPRLLDLSNRQLYAFGAYSSERRGVVTRTVRVVGVGTATIDGRRVRGYRLEDCEGISPPATEIFVDRDGRLLQVVSGKVVMLASTKQRIEQLYAAKRTAAQELLRKTLPAPPPAPPPEPVPPPRKPR